MAPPSLTKKASFQALWAWVRWGTFIFLFTYDFSPLCFHLVGDLTSDGFRPDIQTEITNTKPHGSWIKSMSRTENKLSLHTPKKGLNLCLIFICQTGHFGNRSGSRVWTCLGWWKKHCLFGVSSQRGFAQEPLWEPSHFQIVASGSQQSFKFLL